MNTDILELNSLLSNHYKYFKQIESIEPLSFNFRVNNQLYLVRANNKKYILKRMKVANDFYGIPDALAKLELISSVTNFLAKDQFPIEEIIENLEGKYLFPYQDDSIRVFSYYESREFDSSNMEDARTTFKLAKKLHTYPISDLLNHFPESEKYLQAPYSLAETFPQVDWIIENLKNEKGESWDKLRSHFFEVVAMAEKLIEWEKSHSKVLTHMDLHPRNIVFVGKENAIMIDMDYLRLGNPYVCLGLSLTRVAFFEKAVRTPEILKQYLEELVKTYTLETDDLEMFRNNVLKGAMYMETEKIFRNLYRYYKTKQYRKFAEDVPVLHFPIFKLVSGLVKI